MRWEDERYVRLYTRDTTNWALAPWQARAVLPLVMRKLDRAGMLDLGEDGLEGLAALVQMPLDVVQAGMDWWLSAKRQTFEIRESVLVMPKYLEAQEAKASDLKRAREHRERARDGGSVTHRDDPSRPDREGSAEGANGVPSGHRARDPGVTTRDAPITPRDAESRSVTVRHENPDPVTPSRAVPSHTLCAEPQGSPPSHLPAVGAPPSGGPAHSASKNAPKASADRGKRLREDWTPKPETVRRFRERERVDAMASLERFRNYWLGKSGKDATKRDWERTFVNWVLEDIERGRATTIVEAPTETRVKVPPDVLPPAEAKARIDEIVTKLAKSKSANTMLEGKPGANHGNR